MSSAMHKLLLCFLLLATLNAPAFAQTIGCPQHANSTLKSIEIFDGDPAKLVGLIPEQHFPTSATAYDAWNFWKLGYVGDPAGFTLQCHYSDGSLESLALPASVKQCREDFKKKGIKLACK